MPVSREDNITSPLYVVLGKVAGLWIVANAGFFVVFPLFGYEISYNASPITFSLYFLFWTAVSVSSFSDLFYALVPAPSRIWLYGIVSLTCAALVWFLLYVLSLTPVLQGPNLAPYSDILFASPWFFLPKSIEVLMQQTLIAALVYALKERFHTMKRIMVAYMATFGLIHVLMFVAGSPTAYATIMTAAAVASALIFPVLLLRVRGGFALSYTIHLVFYILIALFLHTWPPPGYYGV